MVKFNAKKLLAVLVATTMVVGSSVTAFAADGTADGKGSYEGNDVGYTAPQVTLPTIATNSLDYIADPNGLIRQSNAAAYSGYTFSGDTGVYFLTDSTGKKYTQNSAVITAYNKSAYPVSVTVTLKQKTAGTNVTFNSDSTFKNSTNKEVYLALVDVAGNTKAISGTNPDTTGAATMYGVIAGKPGNYKLSKGNSGYEYTYASGVSADDNTKWNAVKVRVTGAANLAATWSGATDVPPAVTMTWAISADTAPVKILSTSGDTTVNLTHQAGTTISTIKWGETDLKVTTYTTPTNPTADAVGSIVFKSACIEKLYNKATDDGAVVDIEYADGYKEQIVFVKRY
jgi:hypothetical protein